MSRYKGLSHPTHYRAAPHQRDPGEFRKAFVDEQQQAAGEHHQTREKA